MTEKQMSGKFVSFLQTHEFLEQTQLTSKPGPARRYLIDFESWVTEFDGILKAWKIGGGPYCLSAYLHGLIRNAQHLNVQLIVFMNSRCMNDESDLEWQKKLRQDARVIDQELRGQEASSSSSSKTVQNCRPSFIEWPFMRTFIQLHSIGEKSHMSDDRLLFYHSLDDHVKEIVAYCVQNDLDGLFTDNPELVAWYLRIASTTCPHLLAKPLYTCRSIKYWRDSYPLGRYNLKKFMIHYDLSVEQFLWITGVLLGSRWFPDHWLREFNERLISQQGDKKVNKQQNTSINEAAFNLIELIIAFVRKLGKTIDPNLALSQIFKERINSEEQMKHVRRALEYLGLDQRHQNGHRVVEFPYWLVERREKVWTRDELIEIIKKKSNVSQTSENSSSFKLLKINGLDSVEEKVVPRMYLGTIEFIKYLHTNCLKSPWLYQILTQRRIVLDMTVEFKVDNCPSAVELYRPIRQACYSMLFNDIVAHQGKSHSSTVKITELWYDRLERKTCHSELDVTPNRLYSIENLWSIKQSLATRLAHFMTCLGMPELMDRVIGILRSRNLRSINILLPCLLVRYMVVSHNLISIKEIKAFILMFEHQVKDFKTRTSHKNLPIGDNRAVHLAHLFLRGMEHMYLVNSVCGEPWESRRFYLFYYYHPTWLQFYMYSLNVSVAAEAGDSTGSLLKQMNHDSFKTMFDLITCDLKKLPAQSINLTAYLFTNSSQKEWPESEDDELVETSVKEKPIMTTKTTKPPPPPPSLCSIKQPKCNNNDQESFCLPKRPLGRGSWLASTSHRAVPAASIPRLAAQVQPSLQSTSSSSKSRRKKSQISHRFADCEVKKGDKAAVSSQLIQSEIIKPEEECNDDDEDEDDDELPQNLNPNIELQKEVNELAEMCMQPLSRSRSAQLAASSRIKDTSSDLAIQDKARMDKELAFCSVDRETLVEMKEYYLKKLEERAQALEELEKSERVKREATSSSININSSGSGGRGRVAGLFRGVAGKR